MKLFLILFLTPIAVFAQNQSPAFKLGYDEANRVAQAAWTQLGARCDNAILKEYTAILTDGIERTNKPDAGATPDYRNGYISASKSAIKTQQTKCDKTQASQYYKVGSDVGYARIYDYWKTTQKASCSSGKSLEKFKVEEYAAERKKYGNDVSSDLSDYLNGITDGLNAGYLKIINESCKKKQDLGDNGGAGSKSSFYELGFNVAKANVESAIDELFNSNKACKSVDVGKVVDVMLKAYDLPLDKHDGNEPSDHKNGFANGVIAALNKSGFKCQYDPASLTKKIENWAKKKDKE